MYVSSMNTYLRFLYIFLEIFPFKCEEASCERKFTSPSRLSWHKKAAHKSHSGKPLQEKQENFHSCHICGLQFSKKKLHEHLLEHGMFLTS